MVKILDIATNSSISLTSGFYSPQHAVVYMWDLANQKREFTGVMFVFNKSVTSQTQ
jgi:hypothetical protein